MVGFTWWWFKNIDFVNIDEDVLQWIVDVTNEKLLSTEYGDGWTLDDYEGANIQMDIERYGKLVKRIHILIFIRI